MNEEDEKLVKHFDTCHTSKSFYRYDNLKDALNYAELDCKRMRDNTRSKP
jgi:hypothetical protein